MNTRRIAPSPRTNGQVILTRPSILASAITVVLLSILVGMWSAPGVGAGALLHPARRHVLQPVPHGCTETTFIGAGLRLQGWRCAASSAQRRGAAVYLHGIGDNR